MGLWHQLWQRITSTQQPPDAATTALLGLAALAAVVFAWPWTRILITIVHEGGHALVATLTGRQLAGIHLHRDTSGLTVSQGRPQGAGMIATLIAGYIAPGLFGLGAAALLARGHAIGMLWAFVVGLAVMLLWVRNFYGALVMLVVLAGVGAASWNWLPVHQSWLAYLLTWFWLLAAPRPVIEVARRTTKTSDPGQLARLTGIPAGIWTFCFLLVNVNCLITGVTMLVNAQ